MTIRVLDPTNEKVPAGWPLAPRPVTLRGATVGIISNGKEGSKGYFAHLERMMRTEHGVAAVAIRIKSNLSAPADRHIVDEIRRWQAVITGVGD